MKRFWNITLLLLLIVSFCVFPAMSAKAAKWPSKPIMIVVPWGPGGLSSMLAQLIGEEMGKILGQRCLVVNKPGGSGATGALYVKNAKPDGHTILQAWIAPFVMVPIRNPKVKYDPLKDFDLLAYATENPVTPLALKDKPYDTVREFVNYVKKNPDRTFRFGCGGAMSVHCIFGNQIFHQAGVKVEGVYYQAASKSLPDLLGGDLDMTYSNFQALAQFENVKALGVFSAERVPEFKDVPTIKEQGFEAPITASWSGFAAPAGLPTEVREKLIDTIRTVLTNEKVKKRIFKNLLQFVVYQGPEGFERIIKQDINAMRGPVEQIMEMQKKKK